MCGIYGQFWTSELWSIGLKMFLSADTNIVLIILCMSNKFYNLHYVYSLTDLKITGHIFSKSRHREYLKLHISHV